jgi:hypothetical protein
VMSMYGKRHYNAVDRGTQSAYMSLNSAIVFYVKGHHSCIGVLFLSVFTIQILE